jgi:hypothetical protein
MSTNEEATLNNNGKRLKDLYIFNNFKIMNIFLRHKYSQKLVGKQEGTNRLLIVL